MSDYGKRYFQTHKREFKKLKANNRKKHKAEWMDFLGKYYEDTCRYCGRQPILWHSAECEHDVSILDWAQYHQFSADNLRIFADMMVDRVPLCKSCHVKEHLEVF